MSWCTSKSKVTRVMVLDFLFLCTALLSAQTKPVIERMSARIAEWQKAPTERFVGFEVAFPASPEEAKALANNAFVLVTCVSSKREEASISTAYVIRGDEQLAPTSLSPVRLGTSGFFRSDRLYAVPLKWLVPGAALKVTVGNQFNDVMAGELPPSPLLAAADAPFEMPAKNAPAVDELLKREFPGMEVNPTKVRVSSGVMQGLLKRQVAPLYPVEAKIAHISGTVVLAVTITKEGKVEKIHAIAGNGYLVNAAVEAVRLWEYKPYLLNGQPVDVETTITVNFNLVNF